MNCRNCSAPMKPVRKGDYFFCEYCDSFYFPAESPDGVRVLDGPDDTKCPICHVPLTSASISGIRVLHCSRCKGVLAEQPVFLDILKYQRAFASGPPHPQRPLNQEALQRQIHCPGCGQEMNTHPYYGPGNVVVDNCAHCAVIWLDYGELGTITNAPGRDRAWTLRSCH